jgi:hypothetical protein
MSLKTILLGYTPLPKVEKVLEDVFAVLKRLEATAEAHAVAAEKHAKEIAAREAKRVENLAQIKQAETIVANIRALLTPKE